MYLQFLQQNLNDLLENVPLQIKNQMRFMHDGAPQNFSNLVRQHLSNTFGNQWIGRGGPISWPPRSPDMTPLDFFLWGNLKRLIYLTPVHTRDDLIKK